MSNIATVLALGGMKRTLVPLVSLFAITALVVYSKYREANARPDSNPSAQGSSAFVNPPLAEEDSVPGEEIGGRIDTDLLSASAWGRTSILLSLVSRGAQINARADNGDTALLLAAAYGHAETVDALLALGADVNAKNKLGNTALMEAVGSGRLEIVKALIVKKADVGAKNIAGSSAVDLALGNGRADLVQLLTKHTAISGSTSYNPRVPIDKTMDLNRAASEGNLQSIRALLTAGADVNGRSPNGRTALMTAALAGNTQVVDLLLANGANPNITDYKEGRTALIIAAEGGHTEVARSLLKAGADPNSKDRLGETAMSNAQRLNRVQIGRLLKQAGVKTPSYDQILRAQ